MFVLALLGAVGQVAALPLLACEMMVTPAGALNCHLGMHTSAPLDQLDQLSHLGHSDSSFSDASFSERQTRLTQIFSQMSVLGLT
ncbi:MAG: hypothetical protein ABS30_01185 [OM182 bacterium BACL3 MAG-120924-bin41]|uniref:Uncharacterized protein n=1 Tax=OM182 bacterium BACL3 MAG-120924-bin41 TaxID=1655632 RepID=A0A0R2X2X3_9GAMM|nr:MAG: hypothetical protein ABS30_01185 [OM182 bacterium BACL3 MAG-120924-bin41]